MSEADLVLAGLRIAAPIIADNQDNIIEKIKSGYRKFSKNESIEISAYLTLYIDFKPNYPLESINQYVSSILQKYRFGKNECSHKYNKTKFSILRQYNYSEHLYAPDDFLQEEYDNPTMEEEIEITIPLINGIVFYIFPEDNNIQSQMSDGYNLSEYVNNEIMKKYDIKQKGTFVYIQSQKDKDLLTVVNLINKKVKEFDQLKIKNLSKKTNELKLKNDPLISKILGQVL